MSNSNPIVNQMYEKDWFSQWMGIERIQEGPGICVLKMKVREEMLNGFGIIHGGVTFAFADSALAFACNASGRKAVSIETSISHFKPARVGDILRTKVEQEHLSNKIATYTISIWNQKEEKIALFKGTVYRTSKEWEI